MSFQSYSPETPSPLTLEQEFLALTRRNLFRNPIPAVVGVAIIAIAAYGTAPLFWVMAWVVLSLSGLLARVLMIRHALDHPNYDDRKRLRVIYISNFINATSLCLSLLFFPSMTVIDAVLITLVIGFLIICVVITNAGFARASAPYISMVLIALAAMWALYPHAEGIDLIKAYVLSAFIVFMNLALLGVTKDIHRLFMGAVGMRKKYADMNVQLSDSLDKAHTANTAKTRFLAAASHDLRQPVHTLSLLTAALVSRNNSGVIVDQAIGDITNTMDTALRSLAVQLDSLLDISKLDAGVITPEFDNTDVSSVLHSLKREFSTLAKEKNLDIRVHAPSTAIAFTDVTLLERLLRNLITNAIKYTDSGRIDLSVSSTNEIIIAVEDTGLGIAHEQQALVFEEFYQVDNPHRDRSKGLGLGLSIVSRLCALLKIKLELNSDTGLGTQFVMRLKKGTYIGAQNEPAVISQSYDGLEVLVVDDETSILLATKAYLEGIGCKVRCAETSEQALDIVIAHPPHLAIVDMRLRNHESGIDVLQTIRMMYPNTAAILITGDTAPDRLQEASRAKAKLLHKPVYSDQLQQAMQEVLCNYNGCCNKTKT